MPDIKDLIERAREMVRLPNVHFHYSDGPEVMGLLADALSRLEKENVDKDASIEALEKALRPFAEFGENTNADSWASNIHKEPISTWFGPSDFRRAHEAIAAFDEGTK